MRILIVSNLSPVPANSGGRLRQHHLLKRIASKHEVSYAFHVWDQQDVEGITEVKQYCRHVITGRVHRRPYIRRVPAMMQYLLKGRPPELAFWWSAELADGLAKLAKDETFDLIQIEESFMVPYLDVIPSDCTMQKLFVFHNVSFDQMSKIAGIHSGWRRAWHRFGTFMYTKWEPGLGKQFDRCITVCERDRDLLKRAGIGIEPDVVPNGVDTVECLPLGDPKSPPSFLFIGDMNYGPSIDAAVRFATEILPRIQRQIPEATFRIVGREPSRVIRELASEYVEVTGPVADVAPYYERCTASVVPLAAGGGTRLKILEAMAFARPVISTSMGAEGLDVCDGEHLLIADSPEEFADKAVRLARNWGECHAMVKRARLLMETKYDWDKIAPAQLRIYEQLENGRGR